MRIHLKYIGQNRVGLGLSEGILGDCQGGFWPKKSTTDLIKRILRLR